MKKRHFYGFLFAFMAILGLAFTACTLTETSYSFENHTFHTIVVDDANFTPSKFELPAYTGTKDQLLVEGIGAAPAVSKAEASSTLASITKLGWYVKGDSTPSYQFSKDEVNAKISGTTILFNVGANALSINQAEQE